MKTKRQSKGTNPAARSKGAKAEQPESDEAATRKAMRAAGRSFQRAATKELLEISKAHRKFLAMLRQRKPLKRALSQLDFQSQQWWNKQPWREEFWNQDKTPMDVQKAALIYEGYRRRREVQQAWLEGKEGICANGWQPFISIVVSHLRRSWMELDRATRQRLLRGIRSLLFIPPLGYSTFPDKSAGREEQRKASCKVLRLPPTDDPNRAQEFVRYARRFVDAGCIIVAVDKRKNERARYAFEAIDQLPQTFGKQDRIHIWKGHLPADLPNAERDALEKKDRDGTLTFDDWCKALAKHEEWKLGRENRDKLASGKSVQAINAEIEAKGFAAAESGEGWQTLMSCQTKLRGKRPARGTLVEEKAFNAALVCRDFERIDSDILPHGDFVQRLRLR